MKHFIRYLLFAAGLLALVAGFLISRAPDIHWVLSALSPDYVSAAAGLARLESLDSLSVNDEGFEQIATLLSNNMSSNSNSGPVSWRQIELVSYKGSQGTYATPLGPETKMPVDVRMANGQLVQTNLAGIRNGIDGLKNQSLTFWAYCLFSLGLLVYVFGFVIGRVESKE